MPRFHSTFFAMLVAFSLGAPISVVAQSDEDEQDPDDGDRSVMTEPDPDPPGPNGIAAPVAPVAPAVPVAPIPPVVPVVTTPVSTPTTNTSVVASLNEASGYCVLGAYAIDCLSERLGTLAKEMEGQEEFDEVREILEETSQKLNRVARKNRSSSLAPAKFATHGEKPVETSRRLIPVAEAKLDIAVTQAISVIEEAQTLLLRSAENSNDRTIQYQRISAAIGSNKVLLRSI